jgi:hypothetical protein
MGQRKGEKMIQYKQAWRPHMGQAVVTPVTPVVAASAPASAPLAGAPVPEGLFWTAVAAAASWASIQTALDKKGVASIAGWVGGVGAGLAALAGLTGILAPSAARTLPIRWYWV